MCMLMYVSRSGCKDDVDSDVTETVNVTNYPKIGGKAQPSRLGQIFPKSISTVHELMGTVDL